MVRKLVRGIIGGSVGFLIGAIAGGYLGLIVGGTFLGCLEFPEYTGLQGYELAAYVGAVIGIAVMTPLGIKCALTSSAKEKEEQ